MAIEIIEETVAILPEYGKASMAFWVKSRFRVEAIHSGLGGLRLIEEIVEQPYIKDYDQARGDSPERWLGRWDISNWGVISAFDGQRRIGGVVLALRTPGVNMLENRDDLAVLWDIRLHPGYRRRGIGSRLFSQAVVWARNRGCRQLKIETQNSNVPACRFYSHQGCELGAIHRGAYLDEPHEAQLLWFLDL
jgi:ribosomal protein S18 acetylase RimI-like enzyme